MFSWSRFGVVLGLEPKNLVLVNPNALSLNWALLAPKHYFCNNLLDLTSEVLVHPSLYFPFLKTDANYKGDQNFMIQLNDCLRRKKINTDKSFFTAKKATVY